jgi:hypothetical protein
MQRHTADNADTMQRLFTHRHAKLQIKFNYPILFAKMLLLISRHFAIPNNNPMNFMSKMSVDLKQILQEGT